MAKWSATRPKRVLSLWIAAALASIAAIGGFVGAALTTDDDFTGHPESRRAQQLADRAFPPAPGELRADDAVSWSRRG